MGRKGIRNAFVQKIIFGAAIVYASSWIWPYLMDYTGLGIAIPLSGAIAIIIVEFVADKTGFFII